MIYINVIHRAQEQGYSLCIVHLSLAVECWSSTRGSSSQQDKMSRSEWLVHTGQDAVQPALRVTSGQSLYHHSPGYLARTALICTPAACPIHELGSESVCMSLLGRSNYSLYLYRSGRGSAAARAMRFPPLVILASPKSSIACPCRHFNHQ